MHNIDIQEVLVNHRYNVIETLAEVQHIGVTLN